MFRRFYPLTSMVGGGHRLPHLPSSQPVLSEFPQYFRRSAVTGSHSSSNVKRHVISSNSNRGRTWSRDPGVRIPLNYDQILWESSNVLVPSLPIAVISFLRRDENALYVSDFLDQQASKRRRRCRHLPLDDWNITMYVVFDSASITALSGNMTSCTKPEVLNILQCHQARTENNNVPFLIKKVKVNWENLSRHRLSLTEKETCIRN